MESQKLAARLYYKTVLYLYYEYYNTDLSAAWMALGVGLEIPTPFVSVSSDPLSGYSAQDPRKVGLSAKRRIPGANAFFPPPIPRADPIFPPISQQPTVGIHSTCINSLTKCQSIYWPSFLAFKNWPQWDPKPPRKRIFCVYGSWNPYVFLIISTTNRKKFFYSWKWTNWMAIYLLELSFGI